MPSCALSNARTVWQANRIDYDSSYLNCNLGNDAQQIELADQVSKDNCAVAGHIV
jgi:hypothetical protein